MLSLILLDLSLAEVLANIPHDAGAVIVYLLLALILAFTWYGSRNQPGSGDPSAGADRGR